MTKHAIAYIESGADGRYSVYTEDKFPFGFFGEGNTIDEAKQDFLDTFAGFRDEYYRRKGEIVEAEFEFRLDVSALLQQVKPYLSFVGLAEVTGISRQMLSQYACGFRRPKPKQRQRILDGIRTIGQKLSAFSEQ